MSESEIESETCAVTKEERQAIEAGLAGMRETGRLQAPLERAVAVERTKEQRRAALRATLARALGEREEEGGTK